MDVPWTYRGRAVDMPWVVHGMATVRPRYLCDIATIPPRYLCAQMIKFHQRAQRYRGDAVGVVAELWEHSIRITIMNKNVVIELPKNVGLPWHSAAILNKALQERSIDLLFM